MGAAEVQAFLSALATERHVSASTQNQALAALLFLYREVLAIELPWLDDVVRAKPRQPARGSHAQRNTAPAGQAGRNPWANGATDVRDRYALA